MTAPIPLRNAWLALWDASAEDHRLRVLAHDGDLPDARLAKLRAIGGRTMPLHNIRDALDLWRLWHEYAASPGWADQEQAITEFERIEPEYAEQVREAIARRAAMVREMSLDEARRVLVAAGEMEKATAEACAA